MDMRSSQMFSSDSVMQHMTEATGRNPEGVSAIHSAIQNFSDVEFDEFFELNQTISWILDGAYKRIALQFPDEFLRYSASIAERIGDGSGAKIFILADTSHNSCCVDFVAAEHAKADCLVHYGDACLSKLSDCIPVRYVFGCLPVDEIALRNVLQTYNHQFSANCALLYDTMYSRSAENMLGVLSQNFDSQIVHCRIVDPTGEVTTSADKIANALGRQFPVDLFNLSEVTLIFIGDEQSALLPLWLMTFLNCTKILSFSPLTSQSSFSHSLMNRQLRKRLFLIERIRDASTLAIVVGTLGTYAHKEAVERARELCKKAAKKLYVLSVGKVGTHWNASLI
ncbi:Diphthamide biosynthesis protein 2 [Toxocara canis]|uniref:2-(3-amino-3-carboxypropyl)histidine synthase subunit 2 n=1 Tax=Toxocara canis TaxID=6265 RepID=A0A0B2UUY1_TOXCA|nr:Diphthamide biosynthesis protein 2 [Toxocara canis]